MMLTSLVYFGEHWVIDGLVGWMLVGLSFLFWGWFETRQRECAPTGPHGYLDWPRPPRPGRIASAVAP